MKKYILSSFAIAVAAANSLNANILITEFMYSGANDEFIEFTNFGSSAVDFTGWSFDDNSQTAGSFDLSAFGIVAPGESVILAEATEADFRTAWNLATEVKIIGELSVNLGRGDEINLYDQSSNLVDRLTFGDQDFPGSIRTQNFSGWANFTDLGTNDISTWVLSSLGDAQGSFASTGGDIGNPGVAIPEPGTCALVLGALGLALVIRRRR